MPDASTKPHSTGDEVAFGPHPRAVLCGDPSALETQDALREVSALVHERSCSQVNDLSELRVWLQQEDLPDLFLFVQTWSDEYRFAEILSLPGIGPLSRLLFCYGPWCVSDGRSRPDFPLAVRVPLENLRPALRRELTQIANTSSGETSLPWTAGRDEVFRYIWRPWGAEASATVADRRTVLVHSPDRQLTRLWNDVLSKVGYLIGTADAYQECQIVIWDVDVWSPAVAVRWAEIREQAPTLQIVALTGFVEPDTTARMMAAGAAKVLSKLLPLQDLVAELAALSQ